MTTLEKLSAHGRPVDDLPDWNPTDAEAFVNFIESNVGQKLSQIIAAGKPTLPDGSNPHRGLVALGEARGYDSIVDLLVTLRRAVLRKPNTPTQVENYPSLDDDSKWPSDK